MEIDHNSLRGYHTLQGDNSLKSVEHFDHMMFVCRFQASQWSKPLCYVASEFIALSLLVGICSNFDIYYSGYIQTHCQKNKNIKWADQILPEVYGTTINTSYQQDDCWFINLMKAWGGEILIWTCLQCTRLEKCC
jgi:hypothetical protein